MKLLMLIGITGLTFLSCKKESYLHFSEKQLVFVNYTRGQSLKFIDTASVVQTLLQGEYYRDYRAYVGLFGRSNDFTEAYKVSYYAQNNVNLDLIIDVDTRSAPAVNISFASYGTFTNPDSLTILPSATINGHVYNDVYTIKTYKDEWPITNNDDTATLFHNKEYGVIQLLFPNGKRIVRVD